MAAMSKTQSTPALKPTPSSSGRTNNLAGALILTLSMAFLTVEAAIVRWVGPDVSLSQVIFLRATAQLILIAGWCAVIGRLPAMRTGRPWLHLARGLGSIGNWVLYYYTFRHLDFALSTVLTFATSLFVVILAGPVLGERVRPVSWAATLLGFGGVALAAGVGTVGVEPAVFTGLVAALFAAAVVFLNRTLTASEDMLTILTYVCLIILALSAPFAFFDWRPISLSTTGLLLISGLFGSLSMVSTILAYSKGETAALAPIPYVRIVFAMAVGYFAFSEKPTLRMLAGAGVVVASAVVVTRAEQRRGAVG
jgi:drug/metabolite transporter (DMT)-like permease